jgi:hypothetical protein
MAAATLAALGPGGQVLLADAGDGGPEAEIGRPARPALLRLDPLPGDPGELVRAVQAALRAAGKAAPEGPEAVGLRVIELPDGAAGTEVGGPAGRPTVTLAADRVVITGPAEAGLAERVRDRLVELVEYCRSAEPVYSELDFPDAGLDDAGVAALLSSMGIGPGGSDPGEPRVQP